eukprot:7054873-Prymnesium_polylepis.1
MVQAGCKDFDQKRNLYKSRPLLHHPYRKGLVINVPRIAPPVNKMLETKTAINNKLQITSSDDGRHAR